MAVRFTGSPVDSPYVRTAESERDLHLVIFANYFLQNIATSVIELKGQIHDRTQNFFKEAKTPKSKAWPIKKARQPLARVSPKRAIENVEYEREKGIWRQERMAIDGFQCQFGDPSITKGGAKVPRCRKKADRNPHHIKLRGKNLCNRKFFMATCLPEHHNWIHDNPKEAEELGYLIREYNI